MSSAACLQWEQGWLCCRELFRGLGGSLLLLGITSFKDQSTGHSVLLYHGKGEGQEEDGGDPRRIFFLVCLRSAHFMYLRFEVSFSEHILDCGFLFQSNSICVLYHSGMPHNFWSTWHPLFPGVSKDLFFQKYLFSQF